VLATRSLGDFVGTAGILHAWHAERRAVSLSYASIKRALMVRICRISEMGLGFYKYLW